MAGQLGVGYRYGNLPEKLFSSLIPLTKFAFWLPGDFEIPA
jgi:hypothetical protein